MHFIILLITDVQLSSYCHMHIPMIAACTLWCFLQLFWLMSMHAHLMLFFFHTKVTAVLCLAGSPAGGRLYHGKDAAVLVGLCYICFFWVFLYPGTLYISRITFASIYISLLLTSSICNFSPKAFAIYLIL